MHGKIPLQGPFDGIYFSLSFDEYLPARRSSAISTMQAHELPLYGGAQERAIDLISFAVMHIRRDPMVHTVWKRPKVSLCIVSLLTLCTLMSIIHTPTAFASPAAPDANQKGISWPAGQQLPTFARPGHLDVIDMGEQSAEMQLTLATLEGNINRERPRIYLIEHNAREGATTWLEKSKLPLTTYTDPWKLISKYTHEIRGIIIYDPDTPDTINAATTLAGIKTGIVVHPDMVAKLTAAPYKLPILEDLRGRFKTRLEVVNWEIANLWPQANHRLLFGLAPTAASSIPEDNWKHFQVVAEETNEITNGSNHKVYDIDLSNFLGNESIYVRLQDSFPQGGWGPSVHEVTVKADGQVIAHFIPCSDDEEQYVFDHDSSSCSYGPTDQHRFADGTSYFVYRFTPPADTRQLTISLDMWNEYKISATGIKPEHTSDIGKPFGNLRDYVVANRAMVFWLSANRPSEARLFEQIASQVQPGTPYLGWFDSEPDGVRMLSRHGIYTLAADWFTNLTVHSGIPRANQPPATPATPNLENKIYLTYVASDGDNLQYNEHHMYELWNDPNRGKVPLNWTISPLLRDASPLILNYYQTTATPNDQLIAGPSGMGYFNPSEWPKSNLAVYFEHSRRYLKELGITTVDVLDTQYSPSDAIARAYKDYMNPPGVFYNYDSHGKTSTVAGLPVSLRVHEVNVDRTIEAIKQDSANWDGTSPLFISVQLSAWDTIPARDALKITQALGANYVAVRGDHFFQLYRQANGLPQYHP
ncbi:GxGYxY motif-containing protein [Thermosporothrix hazakensis]|uniref:GxGYxY motif-containing protein n=3 Tax=Thermosporothrix TaxID=768650 RepID=A0A326UI47_THEHA|nr:GxGYxY motif-containing protein [Thermosporothrix hazakensis]